MADAVPLRIFLASPGDLGDEREVVRACVDEHRARRRGQSNAAYEVVGWERVRGTARRPQEAINELIGESHFLIALFKGLWGSEPGSPWGYTSGTEPWADDAAVADRALLHRAAHVTAGAGQGIHRFPRSGTAGPARRPR